MKAVMTGLNCFPVTPFSKDGTVDLGVYRELIEFQLQAAPTAIFAACGTGEFWSLDWRERLQLAREAVSIADADLPVLAGWAGSGPEDLSALRELGKSGVAGVLAMEPTGPSEPEGVRDYYLRIAEATEVPFIIYVKEHFGLSPSWWRRLVSETNAAGIKDGSGDLDFVQGLLNAGLPPASILNGTPTAEWLAPAYHAFGITGYSSAVLNFVPDIARRFRSALDDGATTIIDELQHSFFSKIRELRRGHPSYAISLIKFGVSQRGFEVGRVRPPIAWPDRESQDGLMSAMAIAAELVEGS